jgi:hypothetical protein
MGAWKGWQDGANANGFECLMLASPGVPYMLINLMLASPGLSYMGINLMLASLVCLTWELI